MLNDDQKFVRKALSFKIYFRQIIVNYQSQESKSAS